MKFKGDKTQAARDTAPRRALCAPPASPRSDRGTRVSRPRPQPGRASDQGLPSALPKPVRWVPPRDAQRSRLVRTCALPARGGGSASFPPRFPGLDAAQSRRPISPRSRRRRQSPTRAGFRAEHMEPQCARPSSAPRGRVGGLPSTLGCREGRPRGRQSGACGTARFPSFPSHGVF